MTTIRALIAAVAFLLLAPIASAVPDLPTCPEDRDPDLWQFMDTYLIALWDNDPASYYQVVDDQSRLDEIVNVSAPAQQVWIDTQRELLDTLNALDTSGYTQADQLDHDLMRYTLEQALESARFKPWQTPVSSVSGPQIWLPQMSSWLPTRTREDKAIYVQRLKQVDIHIGDHMDNMRAGIQSGRVMPRIVIEPTIEQTLAQCTPEIREDASRSPFFAPLRALDPDDPLAVEARQIIAERIAPVYLELALFLQNEYLPACRDSVAASDSVDGIAGYNQALASHTTRPDLTAKQIHDTGLERVREIRAEMMDVIARTGWYDTTGNAILADDDRFSAFTEYLRTDPRFYHTDPDALIDEYRVLSKTVDPELVNLFGKLPRLPYGVRRLPRFQEPSAPTAFYYPGDLESAVPGYFMANASKLDQRPRYEMLALTIHEAVPGHHLQYALAQEVENQHPIRKTLGYTAYGEGWALYAERLGLEMGSGEYGLYDNPYDDFGRLNMEMWRACRLVVDTGIHAFDWSRERAIDLMLENTALAPHNIAAEVDRYIGWPGQATAYMIGQQAILDMRARAESALGDTFDIRAFHDAILVDGPLPLPVLDAKIDRWIDAQQNSGP
jgi:uncharacterized protein (DUF885 family)